MEVLPLAILLLVIYVLPIVVAVERDHRNKATIIALNLLLGWTLLGWVGALIWSLTYQG